MGLDNVYQSIPADCILFERAQQDPAFGSYLMHFDLYAAANQEEIDARANDQTYLDFVSAAKLLCEERPGLIERRLFLGRKWDMIHYLLSEDRRNGDGYNDSDWVKRVIHGGEVLNEKIREFSGGHSIFYLLPEEVTDLWIKLFDISDEEFREHWDPPAMCEAGVYKMHATDDERRLNWIQEDFERLRNLYSEAVSCDEGILTWCF